MALSYDLVHSVTIRLGMKNMNKHNGKDEQRYVTPNPKDFFFFGHDKIFLE